MNEHSQPTDSIDWDHLGFAFRETDVFYRSNGESGRDPVWDAGEYLPFGPVELSPAAAFFSYGLGIFEGLKARRAEDGRLLLFRHRDNARRFRRSAERLLLAPFPEDQFVQAIEEIVRRNARFVPPAGKGSLYIRPLQHAIEPKIGIREGTRFWVLIFGCPVGGYFLGRTNGVRLKVLEQGRCAPGGTGAAKAIGNYAGGIALAHHFKTEGFDDVLYLDARHIKYLTETSGSNVFVKLKGGALVTPPLSDQILDGNTRDSVIRIARESLGVAVEERDCALEEALAHGEEIFCTGTAWTVQNVRELSFRDKTHVFPKSDLQAAILKEIVAIQSGAGEDRFGWVTQVSS